MNRAYDLSVKKIAKKQKQKDGNPVKLNNMCDIVDFHKRVRDSDRIKQQLLNFYSE